jgi:predicted outer membrane repeat protein
VIQNCVIVKNHAVTGGGGADVDGPRALLEPHLETDPPFRACRFLGNTTAGDGGAVFTTTALPTFLNCVFSGNAASNAGGAIFINGVHSGSQVSQAGVVNCSFANNTAGGDGRSIFNGEELTIRNSICWSLSGSAAHLVTDTGATTTASDNNIQGDTGTLNTDPVFVQPAGGDTIIGTLDDNLRLYCGSPSIDEGDQAAVDVDQFDVDDNGVTTGEKTPTAARLTRVFQSDVDQGAYETNDVNCPSDVNDDHFVDVNDLIAIIYGWGPCPPPALAPCDEDIDSCAGDGQVNSDDFIAVILDWGVCPGFNGNPTGLPESYEDCVELCDGLSGSAWANCMQSCFKALCETGHPEFCDE